MERNQIPYFSKNFSIECTNWLSLDNGDINPYDIANTFNSYFASRAETTKKSIKYSHKRFSDYLSNEIISTLTASVFKESPSPEGAWRLHK